MVNGDVWTDYPLSDLAHPPLAAGSLGRLLLVPNPDFHPDGDFGLSASQQLTRAADAPRYTYAGISLLHPALIADYPERRSVFPLLEALLPAIDKGLLEGRVHDGAWSDVGTPERLDHVHQTLTSAGE
jgi:MurNAc alpha-1-phosphate uridylyltransferase